MSGVSVVPELDKFSATKITYIDGRATTITLRRSKLVVVRNGVSEEHIFDKDVVTIGAIDDNDLALEDETVSRNHCKIFVEGDQYMIADLGSTNGTFVNRVRIREAYLRPDSVITLGKSEIRFASIDEKVKIVPSNRDKYGDLLIGRDPKMREVYAILEKITKTDTTVVIEGETGTGKEVIARTIHQESRHREGPFIVFDCGAVPENLIESELFGHEKGSFTGAVQTRQGLFELANGGTLFLDELGELALDLQPKLLRALEQREVKRVGGSKPIKVDVRIVAATNRNLEQEVKAGRFREDLFYRLSVVRLMLPSLRERKDDLPLLVDHFLKNGAFNRDRDGKQKVTEVEPEVFARLQAYNWPGNIRELVNVVERACSFADSHRIRVEDLPQHVSGAQTRAPSALRNGPHIPSDDGDESSLSFKDAKERWVDGFERDYLAGLLARNNGNISHAAKEADMDRKYLRKLMKKHGLIKDDSAEENEEAEA